MRHCLRTIAVCSVLILGFGSSTRAIVADDSFFDLSVGDLDLGGKSIPKQDLTEPAGRAWLNVEDRRTTAVLDSPGEVYLAPLPGRWPAATVDGQTQIVIRAPGAGDVRGRLLLPTGTVGGLDTIPFKVARSAAKADAKRGFYTIKLAHYQQLLDRQIPGGAWFRHQANLARAAVGVTAGNESEAPNLGRGVQPEGISATFDFFSGGRAMSENLQLDRALRTAGANQKKEDENSVLLAEIRGITVAEIDWSKLTKDLKPRLDPLASAIPADQHVVFFPTFDDFAQVVDVGLGAGVPTLGVAEPRSEDARTLELYQRQLCLSLSGFGRLVGPKLVQSVALTGSDPFFRTGTDLAILFEAADPTALETLILTQITQGAAKNKNAQAVKGQAGKLKYRGVRSPDRSVCAYVARLGGGVVVTNSPYQLERLSSVTEAQTPAIATLPEYTFFRDRYPLGDGAETAFLFLSDATIRRWCGPRWRIVASRRTRDMAVMNEMQATYLDELLKGVSKSKPISTDLTLAWPGELRLTASGVTSPVLDTLAFQTPISEIALDRVTSSEAEAYALWRDGYERNWRWAFDPIGLRINLRPESASADLTVMPLIAGTDYRDLLSVTQGAQIKPGAGDPHDALAQVVLAINLQSQQVRSLNNFAMTMAPGGRIAPLSWMGETVSLYLDDSPLWAQIAAADSAKREEFAQQRLFQLPVGLRFEVANALKLTVFLAAARAFIDQTAPNMLDWNSLTYRDRAYVKVSPRAELDNPLLKDAALYYAPSASALLFSPVEDVIQRAIDRELGAEQQDQRPESDTSERAEKPGLPGGNLALHADAKIVSIIAAFSRQQYQAAMQWLAWNNLPILNEWHRLYPKLDPVEVHERLWHVRLICPGGGKYVWNENFQTMASTVYGHPGEPKEGPAAPPQLKNFASGDFGLTFENRGLRARVLLKKVNPAAEQQAKE